MTMLFLFFGPLRASFRFLRIFNVFNYGYVLRDVHISNTKLLKSCPEDRASSRIFLLNLNMRFHEDTIKLDRLFVPFGRPPK